VCVKTIFVTTKRQLDLSMGIPGFYGQFISDNVKRAVYDGLPPYVASLAFDLNGALHEARQKVFGDGIKDPRILSAIANTDPAQLELEFQNELTAIILRIVQATQPQDCLILAVDGVAPGAKMQQQRGRREKAAMDRTPNDSFDRNAITPGTDFMLRLDNFITRFIGNYREHLPPKVIYSSHLVPGEGEHKIMDCYRRGEVSDGPAAKQGGAHILYGLDADLIMLSLLSPVNKIFLSRETVRQTVNIDEFKSYLMMRSKKPSAIGDFVAMMFLIGNDFLPHNPALHEMSQSINLLLDIYTAGDYVLTNGNEINWNHMKIFIKAISEHEDELLAAISVKPVKYPSRFLQDAIVKGNFYPKIFRSVWYENALGHKGPRAFTDKLTQIISGEGYSISPVTTERVENMAHDYLKTMAWTYLYYSAGTSAINQDWAYPYYHTPMLIDLAAVAQTVEMIHGYQAYEGMTPFTALHQLVSVLPLKSKDLLPEELHPLFSYNSIIRDLFPETFIIEMDGKNMDHEGVPIVPLIDRTRIMDAVAQINFSVARAKLWMPAEEQVFARTEEETEKLKRFQLEQRRHQEFLQRKAGKGKSRFQQKPQTVGQPYRNPNTDRRQTKPPPRLNQQVSTTTPYRRDDAGGEIRRAPTVSRQVTTAQKSVPVPVSTNISVGSVQNTVITPGAQRQQVVNLIGHQSNRNFNQGQKPPQSPGQKPPQSPGQKPPQSPEQWKDRPNLM
jgi:5'-3' exonuclease